ncbi:MAG: UDP-galactopyranose mutase [Spirochaetaceae bacterium]|nr:UDP-galactopyranose mutase [Spirochaetaceae bacterium]
MDISSFDCLIVGSGFCGSVIARKLAEQGKKVLILERRNHIAGNMYDEIDDNGILVQHYGPHTLHTNNKEVFDFIIKYGDWVDYRLQCAAVMDDIVSPSPFNLTTIDMLYNQEEAENLKQHLKICYGEQKSVTIVELLRCDDLLIRQYAEKLFEIDYRPYTAKQWGIPPEEIDVSVLKRVPVRLDYTNAYFDDTYQVMPKNGFTQFFTGLLNHKNIEVRLNTDALSYLQINTESKKILFNNQQIHIPVVYTGAIDELLQYSYGQLPYRSLRFDYQTKQVDSFQIAPVVAYPSAEGYTRITEYKKLPVQNIQGVTTVAYEYPLQVKDGDDLEPYYPILTDVNTVMYNKYLANLQGFPNFFLCGRLADYKYYNMDNAIMRAFEVFNNIVKR